MQQVLPALVSQRLSRDYEIQKTMNIYLDIETVGTSDPEVIAELSAGITPPGNISKPETIAKWQAETKPGLIEDAIKKTSFDGGLGHIVCIGWAVDEQNPETVYQSQERDERTIIDSFLTAIKQASKLNYHGGSTERDLIFIGHNITGFDLRFLWQRCVVLGLKPPSTIPFSAKPWDKTVRDTMLMWNPERDKRTSLDRLCRMLGIESPKSELDGSKVWDYVKAGRIQEVAEYCRGDVTAMRACYKRMAFL